MSRRHANVANLAEVPARGFEKGSRFALANRALGRATGAQAIGCSHYEVPPGRTAFPSHYHCANEESIYVLEGTGTLRIGAAQVEVGPGDYATFPVGPAHAHQLLNTGSGPLRYLCYAEAFQAPTLYIQKLFEKDVSADYPAFYEKTKNTGR